MPLMLFLYSGGDLSRKQTENLAIVNRIWIEKIKLRRLIDRVVLTQLFSKDAISASHTLISSVAARS